MPNSIAPARLAPLFVRKGGGIRDLIALTLDGAPYDLTTLSNLQWRLSPQFDNSTATLVRQKTTAADREFPDADSGAGGRIAFIVLKAVVDALDDGAYSLQIVSVTTTDSVVVAVGSVIIEGNEAP